MVRIGKVRFNVQIEQTGTGVKQRNQYFIRQRPPRQARWLATEGVVCLGERSVVFLRFQIKRLLVLIRNHFLCNLSQHSPDDLCAVLIGEDVIVSWVQGVQAVVGDLFNDAAHAGDIENADIAEAEFCAVLHQHAIAIMKLRLHAATAREYLIPNFVSDCCKRLKIEGIKYYGGTDYSNYVSWHEGYFEFVEMESIEA